MSHLGVIIGVMSPAAARPGSRELAGVSSTPRRPRAWAGVCRLVASASQPGGRRARLVVRVRVSEPTLASAEVFLNTDYVEWYCKNYKFHQYLFRVEARTAEEGSFSRSWLTPRGRPRFLAVFMADFMADTWSSTLTQMESSRQELIALLTFRMDPEPESWKVIIINQ